MGYLGIIKDIGCGNDTKAKDLRHPLFDAKLIQVI